MPTVADKALIVDLTQSERLGAGFATCLPERDGRSAENALGASAQVPLGFIRRLQQHRGAAKNGTDAALMYHCSTDPGR